MLEHKVYFLNSNLVRRGYEYWYGGARHFFYSRDVPERMVKVMIERARAFAGNSGTEWTVAWERDDCVLVFTPQGERTAPLWRMDTMDIKDLIVATDGNPPEIFVQRFTTSYYLNLLSPAQIPIALNLYEAAEAYPNIRFTIFGTMHIDMWFRSSLTGCVCVAVHNNHGDYAISHSFSRYMPDGLRRDKSPMYQAIKAAAKEYTRSVEKRLGVRMHALLVLCVWGFLLIPVYEKNVRKVGYKVPFNPLDMLPSAFYRREFWQHPNYYRKLPGKVWLKDGNGVFCNTCTIKYRCPLYEPGSVCAVPNTEGKSLADFFNSRKSEDVLTGLQSVLKKQAERVEGAVAQEEREQLQAIQAGEAVKYSDQVTKMLNGLQANAERYLKLVDPRFAKPMVQITNNGGQTMLSGGPRDIDPAQAKRELIQLGMPADAITADHIERYLTGEWNGPRELAALEKGKRKKSEPEIIDAEPEFPHF